MAWSIHYSSRSGIMAGVGYSKKELPLNIDKFSKRREAKEKARELLSKIREKPYIMVKKDVRLVWEEPLD